MRKCKCWQVKIFPQNSWFAQKLHSTILKIFWCFTKPDRPSSEAPAALPSGARDAWHDLSAIQLLSHSHWALCALQPSSSAHLPFSVPLKTSGRPNWATPSHAGWNIQCVTSVCQTGGVTVVPGKSSSTARICLKMWGVCLNTAFHQTLDHFLSEAVRSSTSWPFVPPFSSCLFCFFFISYLCHTKGNLLVFLGLDSPMASCVLSWDSRFEAHYRTYELLLRLPCVAPGEQSWGFAPSLLSKC